MKLLAIYYCKTQHIGRASGRSSVAAAAYRSGSRLEDRRTGLEHDFTRKQGVIHSKIFTPHDIEISRNELWDKAEKAENRKDSRTSREGIIALPNELNQKQQIELAEQFAKDLVNRYGLAVDIAIHAPDKEGDLRNYHAHVLTTTREVHALGDELVLGGKTKLELSDSKLKQLGLEKGSIQIESVRGLWADRVNQSLERNGFEERVDHRSYKRQGVDRESEIHEGPKVTELRRQGIETEISLKNDAIRERNAERQLIKGLEQEIIATERLVAGLHRERIEQSPQHGIFDRINQNLDVADSHLSHIPPIDKDRTQNSVEQVRQAFQKAQELARQEQRQKEKPRPRINPLRQAQMDMQAFNSAVNDRASKLAMNADQKQYEQVKHSLEIVQRERNNLEMQMQNMGKRPILWGARDWDAKHDRLKADWHRTNEREKELKGDIQKADPARFKDLARRDVERDQPELKDKFDKATALRDQIIQQREEPRQNKDQDKQAERQARLEAARAIGEAEKANKAQLDQEREQRAEQQRQQRMR